MDTTRLRYFAACNSEAGFHSFYREVFSDDLGHIYIIKGGPGTGKSSLMRRVADRAEERGYTIEEIYCSSDPASLDGVIARDPKSEDSFAVLDGTAPHVTEMELPGARDEMLYVGEFWSTEQLRAQREVLARDCRARSALYGRLYRYLGAAGQCTRNMEESVSAVFDPAKLQDAVVRILSRYPAGLQFSQKTMLTSSLGMRGSFRFPTFEAASDTVYRVRDCGALSHRLYEEVLRQARRRHMAVWVSYDPLIPTHPDGICLPDCRLSFVRADGVPETEEGESDAASHILSMKRFMNADGYRAAHAACAAAQKCRDRLMEAALDTLAEIRALHFGIEARYVDAMDFTAQQCFIDRWLARILP